MAENWYTLDVGAPTNTHAWRARRSVARHAVVVVVVVIISIVIVN